MGGAAFDPQHVVDQREDLTAAQLVEFPIAQRPTFDIDVEDVADPVAIGLVGALGARVAGEPVREVGADLLGGDETARVEALQGLVDRRLGVAFALEGRTAAVPARLRVLPATLEIAVAGDPNDTAVVVAPLIWSLARAGGR